MNKRHTCCVFSHRAITETEELNSRLYDIIEKMVLNDDVDTFLFGSKSRFNDFCLDIVTEIKKNTHT